MKFVFNIDYNAWMAYQKDFVMHSEHYRRETRYIRFVYPLFIFGVSFLIYRRFLWDTMFVPIVVFLIFPYSYKKFILFRMKSLYKKPDNFKFTGEAIITLDSNGIEREFEHARNFYKWSSFSHVRMDDCYYFLYITDSQAVIIPKVPNIDPSEKKQYTNYINDYIEPLLKREIPR